MRRDGDGSGRAEDGSGSVLVLAGTGAVLTVLVAALVVVASLRAAHTARGAADLAALAAAQESVLGAGPDQACRAADQVARGNGGRLTSCVVGPGSVATVDTEAPVALRLPGLSAPAMAGRARAGPLPPPPRHAHGPSRWPSAAP